MPCSVGDTYVGLTDDPQDRKREHGNPRDWRVEQEFRTEREARAWEQRELMRPGHCGGPGGSGWRYGYKYTVTATTHE